MRIEIRKEENGWWYFDGRHFSEFGNGEVGVGPFPTEEAALIAALETRCTE